MVSEWAASRKLDGEKPLVAVQARWKIHSGPSAIPRGWLFLTPTRVLYAGNEHGTTNAIERPWEQISAVYFQFLRNRALITMAKRDALTNRRNGYALRFSVWDRNAGRLMWALGQLGAEEVHRGDWFLPEPAEETATES